MKINKAEIIQNICYTELVYGRINKKLCSDYTKKEIEDLIIKIMTETTLENYSKAGKNYYVANREYNIKITINSNTFRVITVDTI